MTTFKNREHFTDREITVERKSFRGAGDTFIEVHKAGDDLGKTIGGHMYMEDSVAHALADWITANVPKPEPTPLPTKFAAVVKADGQLYTLAWPTDVYQWTSSTEGDAFSGAQIQEWGFEVIFEGVEA